MTLRDEILDQPAVAARFLARSPSVVEPLVDRLPCGQRNLLAIVHQQGHELRVRPTIDVSQCPHQCSGLVFRQRLDSPRQPLIEPMLGPIAQPSADDKRSRDHQACR